jgi:processive 1,2-diacylglycerol beta-glucosyltransferase
MRTVHPRTILLLTISSGAGHTSAARAVAAAIEASGKAFEPVVVDVAELMTPVARFTHVTAFKYLVTYAPSVWGWIDRYQHRQPTTSPEWFYRRHCRRVFDLAREVQPVAIVATEVGCAEIAALVKRDLELNVPLVAANPERDADRAWVRSEVDLYTTVCERVADRLVEFGADDRRIVAWGPLVGEAFARPLSRERERASVCEWLGLDSAKPIVLVSGGSMGFGPIVEVARRVAALDGPKPNVVALAGRDARMLARFRRLEAANSNLRALGWTDRVPALMHAADLLVSKLGNTFEEAIAAELPIVAVEPPPGAEQVQLALVEKWGVGRTAKSVDAIEREVVQLLYDASTLDRMRANARAHRRTGAANEIAQWLVARARASEAPSARASRMGGLA